MGLTSGAEIAIMVRFIGETLGFEERISLSVNTAL
jgi:hypothetical protein